MRTLTLAMQVSIDGYVEGNQGLNWMKKDTPEQWQDMFGFLHNVDLLLLGRGMWAEYRDYWKEALKPGTDKTKEEVDYARFAEKTSHMVFSQTINEAGWENATIIHGDVVSEIEKIKKRPGKDIHLVGGGRLAATALNAGMVDILTVSIHPVVLGGGKSFFQQSSIYSEFRLLSTKLYSNEVVILTYLKK
ncbi:MAG: dihydrofolate reductase family protein [Flavitalea sp.]